MTDFNNNFKLFARDKGLSTTLFSDYQRFANNYISPTITEERRMNVAQMDVFSRLFMDRILFIGTGIDSDVANIINCQLLFLQAENPEKDITVYINSPGGSVYDGMSIYDLFNFISCPVATTCCGLAASMAAVLLSSGEKGHRTSLPNSRIMVHAPIGGGSRETAPDFRIAAKEMEICENMIYRVLSENTGNDYEYIKKICDRDFWLSPEEAVNEHIIDSVIKKNTINNINELD